MGHREDLLAAARQCLEDRGYAHTTARDLVAASRTNLGSIGYHFGSKEALLNAALAESFVEMAQRMRAAGLAAEPGGDPLPTLSDTVEMVLTAFGQYRGLAVAFMEALAQAERQPTLRAQLAETYQRGRAEVAVVVKNRTGASRGTASALAALQIALVDGLLIQWLLDPDSTPSVDEIVSALTIVLR